MNTKDKLIEKLKELIKRQSILINFISLWGKFGEFLQSQPISAKFIARQYGLIDEAKKELELAELEQEQNIIALSGEKVEDVRTFTTTDYPVAYEWHNLKTGHCYVDYIPHEGQDEEHGYTMFPLFKFQSKEPTDELIEKERMDFCVWYYAQSQPLDANKVYKWMRDKLNKQQK